MADRVRIELNYAGIGKILKSEAVKNLTERKAGAYSGDKRSFVGFDRAKTIVYGERK